MLHIHRAERADGLAAALAQLLSEPLADPFALELVSVPTRGMERWLSQRLSSHLGAQPGRGDGVCAGVLFPPPRRLIGDALAAASGVDPDDDPWLPERAVWPLVAVIDESLGAPWLQTLSTYLGHTGNSKADPVREARRLGLARHLSGLYHRYALHRPEMVGAWSRGDDTDGTAHPLPTDAAWQPELWRALRARIGQAGPAERLAPACRRLREEANLVDLPARVSLFGLTRLPAGDVHVLSALAAQRDVHLFLLHPSPALWQDVASSGVLKAARDSTRAVTRRHDPTAGRAANPLLASWGRDSRELQVILAADEDGHADHHHALELTPRTLLEQLQADVLADRPPPGAPFAPAADGRIVLAREDRSVQIHACHGRARQVEVLRDAVLHLLAQDTTLEPRDVIVMCPDIETFAPLIQATFGAGEPPPDAEAAERPPGIPSEQIDLRVRLADRSLRQTNPILAAVAELLELAGQRVTASQVLGFADREPVRRRFGFRDEDLSRLQRWISDSGIRWGLDAAHRAPFKLEELPSGTWRAGLDRLLVGVTMTEEGSRLFEKVLPLDDVESGAIELAGRLAELVDRLGAAVDALSRPQTVEAWASALGDAADALTVAAPREAWQRVELQRVLDDLVAETDRAGATGATGAAPALALPEIRALVADRLAGRPTRANFRTGHLTVCTLYPMRSVPHRVVCLLGLDDGAFPRKAPRDGDDLMLIDPRVGERDPRSEDRQLLLDGLLAATGHLVVTYTGNDERTNLPRPPAVPVGELLDAIDATARTATGAARDQVLVRHPLQPFDRRNFSPGELVPGRPWSFDRVMLAGARALELPPATGRPFLSEPLPPLSEPVIALEDLVRFVQHPVRAFLRQRLRIYLGEIDDEVDDALPVELDGLERWGVGQRLLDAALAGTDGRAACLAEIARGTLPPGQLGEPVVRRLYPIVAAIEQQTEALAPGTDAPAPLDVHVVLGDGRLLSGTVSDARGDLLLTSTFSRVAAKHRLSAWVRLLAATASAPERALSAVTIGRGTREDDIAVARIGPLAPDPAARKRIAEEQLAALVDLFDRGMREPLPLFCGTSAAYAAAPLSGEDPIAAARKLWDSNYKFDGEGAELEHQLVLGGERELDDVLAIAPAADESGEGWVESETSRFGRLARRLWDGLLAREERRTG